MKKETQEQIQQLQMLEQNIQQYSMQKQQFQQQLAEIDSALNELKDSKQCYKIVGNLMVLSEKNKINEELEEKKKIIELRIKTYQNQEEKLNEKIKSIQAEVMKNIK